MKYTLALRETASATGFFSPTPSEVLTFEESFSHIRAHPLDSFMHGYLLNRLIELSIFDFESMLDIEKHAAVLALLYEAILLHGAFSHLRHRFDPHDVVTLAQTSPMPYIRSSQIADQRLHGKWTRLFRANIQGLMPLPRLENTGLEPPFPLSQFSNDEGLESIFSSSRPDASPLNHNQTSPEATARRVLEELERLAVLEGNESRHVSSLSPIALMQKWRMNISVRSGRNNYRLSGIQTAYGRGLDAWSARVGYAMEIVERRSAFADIEEGRVMGTVQPHELRHGTWESLQHAGVPALDPNRLQLEVPYTQAPVYWMKGETPDAEGETPMWLPAQIVYLFSNLDEINIFSGFGSTGLAAGNTFSRARLGALLECVERDADAVTPFDPSRCFRIIADDPEVSVLLQDYRNRGLHVGCQEITTEIGIPVYRCFVVGMDGQAARGTGAHLNGKRALLSALTETPYPYPYGPPSLPITEPFTVKRFESLPNLETGCESRDLSLAESLLSAKGYRPIYVDLTRSDLPIPVVRAVIPGLEMVNDFDFLSRVSPRLFANYLKMVH